MQQLPEANDSIKALQPYRAGTPIAEIARTHGMPESDISKLASNENPRGPGKSALDAVAQGTSSLRLYPDTYDFVHTIAAHHNVSPEQVVVGNGSNDILDLIARTYLGLDDETIMYEHSFLIYKLVSTAAGATIIETKAKDFGYDLRALQDAISDKTRVIWIDNPNNPTGTFIHHDKLTQFLSSVPPRVLVVLDEAYWDYLPDAQRIDSVRWIDEFPNLCIVRTFSKIHGLAALRIGYLIAHPEVAETLNRLRQPFNANSLGLAAATASIRDTDHIADERDANQAAIQQLTKGLDVLNLEYIPSHTNFVTVKFKDSQSVCEALLQHGLIVRPIANYGLGDYLRITAGAEGENRRLLDALADAI